MGQMLGDGWDDPMHASILEGMVKAPLELVAAFRMLAHKQDPLMPQEAELIFRDTYMQDRACTQLWVYGGELTSEITP